MTHQEEWTIARKPPAPPSPPEGPPDEPARMAAAPPRRRATVRPPSAPRLFTPPGTPRKKAAAAGPARGIAGAPREQAEAARLDELQHLIVTSLEDDKADAVVALDLAGRASFADRMVIASGVADRQIAAMATHLEEKLREAGLNRIQVEGAGGADWVLIDAGDIVIHLFKPEARAMYALERMWGAELDEEPQTAV